MINSVKCLLEVQINANNRIAFVKVVININSYIDLPENCAIVLFKSKLVLVKLVVAVKERI